MALPQHFDPPSGPLTETERLLVKRAEDHIWDAEIRHSLARAVEHRGGRVPGWANAGELADLLEQMARVP